MERSVRTHPSGPSSGKREAVLKIQLLDVRISIIKMSVWNGCLL